MDGTAMMQGVATVFIANAYGLELHGAAFLTVILTATLASIRYSERRPGHAGAGA